jgi:hypothetical protein
MTQELRPDRCHKPQDLGRGETGLRKRECEAGRCFVWKRHTETA